MVVTRRYRRVRLWLLLLACLALAGCTGYRAPSIKVAGAQFIEQTDEAVTLRFDLDLENPNTETLELRQFDYRVSIDGRRAYTGRRAAEASLAAGMTKRLTVPAVLRFDEMGWDAGARPAEVTYGLSGSLLYVTPGEIAEILLDTGVRKPRARFSGKGKAALAPLD